MRPNEAATGEGKRSLKREKGDEEEQPRRANNAKRQKHKPQKKLPATAAKQQQEVVVKERAENEKAAEREKNVRKKFGLKFAYEQILRCFIKFSTRQDESKTSEAD